MPVILSFCRRLEPAREGDPGGGSGVGWGWGRVTEPGEQGRVEWKLLRKSDLDMLQKLKPSWVRAHMGRRWGGQWGPMMPVFGPSTLGSRWHGVMFLNGSLYNHIFSKQAFDLSCPGKSNVNGFVSHRPKWLKNYMSFNLKLATLAQNDFTI